jgi:hypothetical protein
VKGKDKYFVGFGNGEYVVIYQDMCEFGGSYWATEKVGFANEKEAQEYANELNATASFESSVKKTQDVKE